MEFCTGYLRAVTIMVNLLHNTGSMWLHNFAKLFGYGNILVTEKLLTSHSVFVFTGNFGKYYD